MNRIFRPLLFLLIITANFTHAQINKATDIVKWKFDIKKVSGNTYDLIATAKITDPEWHIYTENPGGDGSLIPSSLTIEPNPNLKKVGKMKVTGKKEKIESDIIGTYYQYVGSAVFTQRIELKENTEVKGYATFQTCNESGCLPPYDSEFKIKVNDVEKKQDTVKSDTATALTTTDTSVADTTSQSADSTNTAILGSGIGADSTQISAANTTTDLESGVDQKSLLELFLAGIINGILAFIMPCIFAMLPVTVSFFTKRSKDRATGIKNALLYAFSIIVIFAAIGALISILFGPKTMYEISSSNWFNIFVFLIFVIFGISLMGAFEINLPSSWSAKLDSRANTNSFIGIFFMALVLVVVSFSCTSAFISILIVYIVKSGNSLGGIVGFTGFGLAIALPFALGALFPGMINKLAKSGGWLNAVKVTLGFLELAFAMKFLSNVDLANHWGILDFEVYVAIWIVLFGLLGLYLLGKLKFAHDEELPKNIFGQPHLSITRLFFAIAALSFTVYMIPGLWGAPLTAISGFLPERKTLEFNIHDKLAEIQLGGGTASIMQSGEEIHPVKYADFLKSELPGIISFFDYEEALAAGKKMNKPVLLDFTGHSCINCRKMERDVLSKPEVLRRLKSDFIVASLYTDDRTTLPVEEQYITNDGSKVRTLGQKNLDLEYSKFGNVAQPLYIFVDGDGNVIKNAGGYVNDIQRFIKILDEVKQKHGQSLQQK